jgi:hypothetical protein
LILKNNHIVFIFFALFFFLPISAQRNFQLLNNVEGEVIPFKFLSNLIVFPMEVNGNELNFILDSGVSSTILFNLSPQDSLELKNIEQMKLKGLGSQEPVNAFISTGNEFKMKNIFSSDQKMYVIFDDGFDLSSKLGITIHGIIGYELFKDFVVQINYHKRKVFFYNSENYIRDDCKKCETFPLEFYKNKPYINAQVVLSENRPTPVPVKLLIDSGGSDAMWLFEGTHPEIKPPTNYFEDFLGEGLSGAIYGKRTIIESLNLGNFQLNKPTVSYPDSLSVAQALKYSERNGSLGSTILQRFVATFDYKKSVITLKKSTGFKNAFRYNMSGIELIYNGKILVKELENSPGAIQLSSETSSTARVLVNNNYKYTFKPTYKIQKVHKGSPAYEAGIEPGDILIKINGQYTYDLKIEEIVQKFYEKENTKITVVVERRGLDYQYSFKLRNILN